MACKSRKFITESEKLNMVVLFLFCFVLFFCFFVLAIPVFHMGDNNTYQAVAQPPSHLGDSRHYDNPLFSDQEQGEGEAV